MKYSDKQIIDAVDRAIADMKKRGDWPTQKKKGSLTDKSGKEHTKNFEDFCDLAIKDGHDVVVLKETYENVKFTIDGMKADFPKVCKDVKAFYELIVGNLEMRKKIEKGA